jgi:hypothetical protein
MQVPVLALAYFQKSDVRKCHPYLRPLVSTFAETANVKRRLQFIVCQPRKTNFLFPLLPLCVCVCVCVYIYIYIYAAISNEKTEVR